MEEEPEAVSEDEMESGFEDVEAMLDLLQQPEEEDKSEPEAEETAEVELSQEPVAVDDIFQDALSAVGYSEGEEEAMEPESQMQEETQFDDIFALDEIMQESGLNEEEKEEAVQTIPPRKEKTKKKKEKKPKKEKKEKNSIWQRLFGNIITEETAALEEKERELEEEAFFQKQAAALEKEKKMQLDKEEKEKKSQEEKERKKQIKAEKEAKKAEKKEEKKRLKQERAAMEETEVVGKINPIGATIVFILFATIGIATLLGVWLVPRKKNIKQAENQYAKEQYIDAYQTISTVSIKEDEQTLYDKIDLCSRLQRQIQSYQVNLSMDDKLEALNALLQGLAFYNENQEEVQKLQIQKEFLQMKTQLVSYLAQDFQVDENQANEINGITDETQYTQRLQQIVDATK